MATVKGQVSSSFTGNGNSGDDHQMGLPGAFVFDLVWASGTLTVDLHVSIDGGTTFVQARDDSGTAMTFNMATGLRHVRRSLQSQAGVIYRLVATSGASTPVVQYKFGRADTL